MLSVKLVIFLAGTALYLVTGTIEIYYRRDYVGILMELKTGSSF